MCVGTYSKFIIVGGNMVFKKTGDYMLMRKKKNDVTQNSFTTWS